MTALGLSGPAGPVEEPLTPALEAVIATARRLLYLPDPAPLLLVLAAAAANRMTGDPAWLLLVGPPSSGKTELLMALAKLPEAITVSTFTEAGLLSGARSRDGSGTGGLLRAKELVVKPGDSRRYHVPRPAARTIAALVVLREQVIGPILAGLRSPRQGRKPAHWTRVDRDYETIRVHMQTLFADLAIGTAAAAA